MNRKLLVIIGGALVALCLVCGGIAAAAGVLGFGLTQPAASVGDSFMQALKDGDFNKAYSLCTPALQRELGSARSLESKIKNGSVRPTHWSFNSRDVNNDQSNLSGDATFIGNTQGKVQLVLEKSGNDWKVSGFDLSQK